MSNDRYENIRLALAMEPMPGPWLHDGDGVTADDEDVAVAMCCPSEAEAAYIAACNPDTIRALLEERDELVKLVMEMRGTLRDLRMHLHAAGRRPEECYEMSMIDDALHRAAIDQAQGKGGP